MAAKGALTTVAERHALALLGASEHARSIEDVAARLGGEVSLVIDPNADPAWGRVAHDDREGLELARDLGLVAVPAVGDNALRDRLAGMAAQLGVAMPPLVAKTATLASSAAVGPGTVILEHAHIGPQTVIGRSVIVNTRATVEHDTQVKAGAHLGPGAILGGAAIVGCFALLGSGAIVLPGVRIGDQATVGAGAVVLHDVEGGKTVVGVPANEV
jgi:sugar O-acyltransferase (sialic acid O-acetyltransferase NeuD family)